MLEVHYTESDRQRLEACVRREVRLRFYQHDDPTITQLVDDKNETLFAAVMRNDKHVPHYILPDRHNYSYSLRPRCREFMLATKRDCKNFFERLLLKTCVNFSHCVDCVLSSLFTTDYSEVK